MVMIRSPKRDYYACCKKKKTQNQTNFSPKNLKSKWVKERFRYLYFADGRQG